MSVSERSGARGRKSSVQCCDCYLRLLLLFLPMLFCQVAQWEAATREVERQVADKSNSLSVAVLGFEMHRSKLCRQLEVNLAISGLSSGLIPHHILLFVFVNFLVFFFEFLSSVPLLPLSRI